MRPVPLAVTKNAALLLLLTSDWPTGSQGQQEMELKLNTQIYCSMLLSLVNGFKKCVYVIHTEVAL